MGKRRKGRVRGGGKKNKTEGKEGKEKGAEPP